ncbi:MAG: hypothetical protein FGM40_01315 [Rhodocyclaceae bacterium]|nr:hypothetical protein [Rhodocyclaceae bacterium]
MRDVANLVTAISLAAQCRDLPVDALMPGDGHARPVPSAHSAMALSAKEGAFWSESVEAMRHRLRSYLDAVAGYAQLIEMEPDDATRQVGAIRAKVDKIFGVINRYVWQFRNLLDRELTTKSMPTVARRWPPGCGACQVSPATSPSSG